MEVVLTEFERFATPSGYTQACRFLAFDRDRWYELDQYTEALRTAIEDAKNRTASNRLVGVDLACGEYAWLARHFSNEFSQLYLLDQSAAVDASTQAIQDETIRFVLGDGATTLALLNEVDFVYCGFSFYQSFVKGLVASLAPAGCFFVMVPVDGDDLRWRETVSGRTIAERRRTLDEIEAELRSTFEMSTEFRNFHWVFAESEVATVVAASAVVCFGWDRLTPQRKEQLELILQSLATRPAGGKFSLTQEVVLWRGYRKGGK